MLKRKKKSKRLDEVEEEEKVEEEIEKEEELMEFMFDLDDDEFIDICMKIDENQQIVGTFSAICRHLVGTFSTKILKYFLNFIYK